MPQPVVGLIGLAVMGENLALNLESKDFPIAVFNRTTAKTNEFIAKRCEGREVVGTQTIEEFVGALEPPRRIILMVKAGEAVDQTLALLRPLLAAGDIVIDGGNSFFKDTERREHELAESQIQYFGMGVSGGEEGALNGPSLMPGGGSSKAAWDAIYPMLKAIAAQSDDGACMAYAGHGGAGHFVKMVHNGIEYGDMQLIAEAYDLLKNAAGLEADELHSVFREWNQHELQSFLIEITAHVANFKDPETGGPLLDLIQDRAGQKGTGKWVAQVALDLGVPLATINAAVEARFISALKAERVQAGRYFASAQQHSSVVLPGGRAFVDQVRQALYASKICSYAQGFALLSAAQREFKYQTNLEETAKIWKGGCIIRARFLDHIKEAYQRHAELPNLMMDEFFSEALLEREQAWRRVVSTALTWGFAVPAMTASLGYFDAYRRERTPANLIQAQRDLFGAHTYERTDREGSFHTDWGW